MKTSPLTKEAFLDLRHMLDDGDFKDLLFTDEKEVAKHVKIETDGSIILGKTKCTIINRIFRGEIILSANDICIKLISVITGKGGARNSEAFKSLLGDWANALDKGDYSYAITRIFIAYRLGYLNDIANMRQAGTNGEVLVQKANDCNHLLVKDGFDNIYAIKLGRYK